MNTTVLLSKDCRTKEGREIINKALLKIKPFAKYECEERVPIEAIEIYVEKVCRKYDVKIQYMNLVLLDEESRWYTVSIMTRKEHKWLGSVHGYSLYEAWAKVALQLCIYLKKEEIKVWSNDNG